MFNSLTPGHSGPLPKLASTYTRLDALKAKLDAHRPLAPEVVKNLHADMVVRYTYHSNAIEGNTLTISETKVVLEDGVTIGGKSMREHLEAINHREAIDYVVELAGQPGALTEAEIKNLHQIVLKSVDSSNAGRYRQQNVLISGAGFTPPNFLHVREHMEAFCAWCAGAAASLHPVERAARVHADFVNIHPFVDGNGRTARLLMNLELMRAGFPVVIVPVEERSVYYANLDTVAVKGDYAPFVEQVCDLVEKSFAPYWFVLGVGDE
ncbi:Fic family protein [Desulfovibrio desulfuricans]|uniref:Fic family protein n=1 Tax=Desulfovibrio desulfuricans TaxID=876 RepID=UPI0003B68887|nr:Fic family protein [Desulfovibrio desulfuricans]